VRAIFPINPLHNLGAGIRCDPDCYDAKIFNTKRSVIPQAMNLSPRIMTILAIAIPLNGIFFAVHAQTPNTATDQTRSKKSMGVNPKYTQIISLQPDSSLFFLSRGDSRFGIGDYAGALADYNQALQLDPNNAAAYYNRGEVHHKLGNKKKAITDLKKAVKIFHARGDQDDYQDALNHLKRLRQSPK
jgi:tetratricopeptide (TPR) repeat protein